MLIRLDSTAPTPVYLQLRNQIVLAIGDGTLKNGEGLPSVRQLAEDSGVNMMTVTKAYHILKEEGFIEIDRRRGARISPRNDQSAAFREKVEEELGLLITESAVKGFARDEFLALCRRMFDNLRINGGADTAEEGGST